MHSYGEDLHLFRDRRFALLFAARTASVLGGAFAPVALAFGVLGLAGATPTTLSLVLVGQAVPQIVFMLAGGVLADRLPRYRVMIAGELLCAAAYLLLSVMLVTGRAPLPALVAGAALSGVGVAVLFPAILGIVPEVVSADRLQTANGLLRMGTNTARLAGFTLGGTTVVLLGGGPALAFCGAFFALSGVFVAGLRPPRTGEVKVAHVVPDAGSTATAGSAAGSTATAVAGAGPGRSVVAELRAGWREFVGRQWLWVMVVQFAFTVATTQAVHGVLGPVLAQRELGGAGAWSAVLVGEAVGMLIGVAIVIRLRPRRPMLVAVSACLAAVPLYLLLGLSAPLWTVVLAGVVTGICVDIGNVLWETTLQREIRPELLSRISAYDALGSFMFGPIGLLLVGAAATGFGPRPAMLCCAGVVLLAAVGALCSPSVRHLRAPQQHDTAADGRRAGGDEAHRPASVVRPG
ncbi:MFS transporter [Micromonospora sp. NBC_01796]|uniref:MFS transporter n=1 Tax=Micromonospora sp. NBC_01796 TaxID=2975987 RepID=UPI002DDA187C|nr:MFS transporter [Micromonospora sp. NBC_01796]WSA87179.1 MFS transporter [Micromonospora sp. NBC_01796]